MSATRIAGCWHHRSELERAAFWIRERLRSTVLEPETGEGMAPDDATSEVLISPIQAASVDFRGIGIYVLLTFGLTWAADLIMISRRRPVRQDADLGVCRRGRYDVVSCRLCLYYPALGYVCRIR